MKNQAVKSLAYFYGFFSICEENLHKVGQTMEDLRRTDVLAIKYG